MINPAAVTPVVVFAGLLGAISWNFLTWLLGQPTCSSHAIIGASAGAAVIKAGPAVIIVKGWVKTIVFIFLAHILGMILGILLIWITVCVVYKMHPAGIDK